MRACRHQSSCFLRLLLDSSDQIELCAPLPVVLLRTVLEIDHLGRQELLIPVVVLVIPQSLLQVLQIGLLLVPCIGASVIVRATPRLVIAQGTLGLLWSLSIVLPVGLNPLRIAIVVVHAGHPLEDLLHLLALILLRQAPASPCCSLLVLFAHCYFALL